MSTSQHRRSATQSLAALLITAALLTQAGCDRTPPAEPTPDLTDRASYENGETYTVRGTLMQLPAAGPPPKALKIHHEHIPTFIGASGDVFVNSDGTPGMKAMVMEFPNLAPGVSLEDLTVGDNIEFEFLVRWDTDAAGNRTPTWLVDNLRPLPPGTELSFENKTAP